MSRQVDFTWLPAHLQAELTVLAQRFGAPVVGSADLGTSPYLRQVVERRFAEICMVVRRPSGRLLIERKLSYPAAVFRLPTGGIESGESIVDALLREIVEETGLAVAIARFLAASTYHTDGRPQFASFAFLLNETGGTLGALDPDEHVESFREIETRRLPAIARQLEHLPPQHDDDDELRHWGRLRALNHRLVWRALQ